MTQPSELTREQVNQLANIVANGTSLMQDDAIALIETTQALRQRLAECQERLGKVEKQYLDLREPYQRLIQYYDKQEGTPCEQIRHQQEIEKLTAELNEYREIVAWYGLLVERANIGTKETPSLKAYIEQLEAKLKGAGHE